MPFVDFSSAVPWIASGFLAGLIVAWLIRKISGVDARRRKEIEQLHVTLDDARRAHEGLQSVNAQLEAERSRLTSEVNQLSPRAALLPQVERQAAELKQALNSAQDTAEKAAQQLEALRQQASGEIAALRQDAEVKGSTAKYYEEEYGRLHAAHQALNKDWTSASGLVSKLQSDYAVASREAQEATRLRSDVAALRAQIESLTADVAAAKQAGHDSLEKARVEESARASHAQGLIQARDSEIATLKADADKLKAELQASASQKAALASEIDGLKSKLASVPKEDLSAEVARLTSLVQTRESELSSVRSERGTLAGEIDALKAQLAAAPKQDLAGEVQRLQALVQTRDGELQAAQSARSSLASEVQALTAQLASAPRQDLSGEVYRLTAELAKVSAQERQNALDLHAARTDLGQVRTALEETTRLLGERHGEVEELRAKLAQVPDVESYRRFKDALEAANRIAAGLPEKS